MSVLATWGFDMPEWGIPPKRIICPLERQKPRRFCFDYFKKGIVFLFTIEEILTPVLCFRISRHCPSSKHPRPNQIQRLLDHIFVHGIVCSKARFHVHNNWLSPIIYCTYLKPLFVNVFRFENFCVNPESTNSNRNRRCFLDFKISLHLKQNLCHLYPPAHISSAAYTDFPHFGHFACSKALNPGIVWILKMNMHSLKIQLIDLFAFFSTFKYLRYSFYKRKE